MLGVVRFLVWMVGVDVDVSIIGIFEGACSFG